MDGFFVFEITIWQQTVYPTSHLFCLCVHASEHQGMLVEFRDNWENQFPDSTMWTLEIPTRATGTGSQCLYLKTSYQFSFLYF